MKTTSLLAGAVFMLLPGTVMAVGSMEVDSTQAANLQKMGTVQIVGVEGSFDDASAALQAKATEAHAGHYHIVVLTNASDSSLWIGTAELYK